MVFVKTRRKNGCENVSISNLPKKRPKKKIGERRRDSNFFVFFLRACLLAAKFPQGLLFSNF